MGLLLSAAAGATASPQSAPQAPEWVISQWLNDDPGSIADNRDRVILIDFFQLWCPGCNRFSIPLFQQWDASYGGRDDVLIVSIHTVFEGHAHQGPSRLRSFVADNDMRHPVGIDAYADPHDETPITMRRFRTRGTPHVVILDKRGRVRFSRFGSFDIDEAETLIEVLLGEDGPSRDAVDVDPDGAAPHSGGQ
jgi:thiol-disulfide isomerase/thioredoxin